METWLITGGAGFIGTNMAGKLLSDGRKVVVIDDLSRAASFLNLGKIRDYSEKMGGQGGLSFFQSDIRDRESLDFIFRSEKPDVILHLAAQTAVTTSLEDPRKDFEINALGTLNVLEAWRLLAPQAVGIMASTNKVYGPDVPELVAEWTPLDLYSPYGCSKGAADCYWRDYSRIFGLRSVVFRMSCIYGLFQRGTEDQGWVAHFYRQWQAGNPVRIFGDGNQVRDLLHVSDLTDLYSMAAHDLKAGMVKPGQAFNVGGGPDNTLSINGLADHLSLRRSYHPARPGDQARYVSDITKVSDAFEWIPAIGIKHGLRMMEAWIIKEYGLPPVDIGA